MSPLPPMLRQRLRQYRFAWWCVAIAETLCAGAVLVAFADPNWVPLAGLWLIGRYFTRPTNSSIVQRMAAQQPDCGERLTAAVSLAESTDPAAIKGSPDLLDQLYREADSVAATVDVSLLLSLRPMLGLLAAALLANGALALRRQRALDQLAAQSAPVPAVPIPLPAPVTPVLPPAAAPATPTDWLAQLKAFADKLDAESGDAKRGLPSYARSLRKAVESAEQAVIAGSVGDLAQAQMLQEKVAEDLAEFARVARLQTGLAAYAAIAEALAEAFAEAARRSAAPAAVPSPSGQGVTNALTQVAARSPAGLPPAPTGPAWQPSVTPAPEPVAEHIPPDYRSEVRDYYERIAQFAR